MASIFSPIKRLPVKNSPSFATVRVVPITQRLLDIWRYQVQPVINQKYDTAPCHPDARIRADVGWNWSKILSYALVHDLAFFGQKNRSTLKLCVVVVPENGDYTEDDYFPIGMVTLVPKFKCNAGKEADRAFTWYLSNAPREIYDQYLGGVRIEGVAKMLLDCVVQAAYDIGADGSMLLRAATEGGNHLRRFYGECRLHALKTSNGKITFIRRETPEEYFLLTKTNAKILSRWGNVLRV